MTQNKGGTNSTRLILTNYVRYERLRELCGAIFGGLQLTSIDIYMDLNSMLSSLYTDRYKPELDESPTSIASAIINMIAHYRRFFWGYKIETRFFMVFSNWNDHSIMPGYNENNIYQMKAMENITKLIINNLSLVEEIVAYIPDSAMLTTSFDPGVAMFHIMNTEAIPEGRVNLIISKDIVLDQLAAIAAKTIIIRPKKHQGEDTSYYVSPLNGGLYRHLCDVRKVKYKEEYTTLNQGLFSMILAMSRVPERSLKSIVSIPAAFDEMLKIVQSGKILNGYNTNIENYFKLFSDNFSVTMRHGGLEWRYRSIDYILSWNKYVASPERFMYNGCKNLYDPKGLHDIDTKYFKNCPLNMEYL